MSTATIELSTPDGPMALYEATPDGDSRGAVIVIQEAFGVNDHIQDVARRFAAEGYHAVAPALFGLVGDALGVPTALMVVAGVCLLTLPLALVLRPMLPATSR